MADERNFELEIITPDRVFWKGEAFMIELTTTEGEGGIYKRHIPMTMIIAATASPDRYSYLAWP